jgi:hypothetical protein
MESMSKFSLSTAIAFGECVLSTKTPPKISLMHQSRRLQR